MKTKLILLLASLLTTVGGARGEDLYYIYNGQRVELRATPGKLAVQQAAPPARSATSQSVSASAEGESLGLDGWSLIEAPAAAQRSATASAESAASAASDNAAAAAAARAKAGEAGVAFATPVFDLGEGQAIFPSSNVLVRFKAGVDVPSAIAFLGSFGVTGGSEIGASGVYSLTTNARDGVAALNLANRLAEHPSVATSEPSFFQMGNVQWAPNDPSFDLAWGLRNNGQSGGLAGFDMDATTAWDLTRGSSSVIVVVFECGIDPDHPDINAVPGRDFTNQPIDRAGPRPTGNTGADNHGTWVAGVITGRANNGIGATGIAPDCRIASARIGIPTSGGSFTANNEWIIAALDWARSIGARVTNHSYTMGAPSSAIDSALQRARNAGIVNFAATGNANSSSIGYPASSPYCLGVGAANRFGNRASFSNYGTGLDFLAPGEEIITTDRLGAMGITGDYAMVNGTSFASPYAAGVAALIISRNPTWNADQVEAHMKSTCRDMGPSGYDTINGHGLINASRALGATPQPPVVDDHGNTMSTATAVGIPSLTTGVINASGDQDWFRFVINVRSTVTLTTESRMDTWGDLINSIGSTIAWDDDSGASGRDFRIVATLNPGTYFVRVQRSVFSSTGSYNLRVSATPTAAPSMAVTGKRAAVANGSTTTSAANATDFTSVKVGASKSHTFTIANAGNAPLTLSGSPRVSISGPGAASFQVTVNPVSSISPGNGSGRFTIRFAPVAAGTQTATISIASNDPRAASYTFTVSGVGRGGTSDDHGNIRSSATRILRYGGLSGRIERGGDVDYFFFTISSTTTVRLFSTSPTNLDVTGALEDANGSQLAYGDDEGGNNQFSITRTLTAGTYYVKVQAFSSETTGSYTLNFSRL